MISILYVYNEYVFQNCENMTTYATNEYALNTSLSKFQKGNYTLYRHVTGIESFLFPRVI